MKLKKTIKELLAMGHIRPSKSSFTSSVVLALELENSLVKGVVLGLYWVPYLNALSSGPYI